MNTSDTKDHMCGNLQGAVYKERKKRYSVGCPVQYEGESGSILAVTKSGTGTWDLGRGDSGTWGRGDAGTRGLGDSGTWGLGDVGTWGLGDSGTWGRGDTFLPFV